MHPSLTANARRLKWVCLLLPLLGGASLSGAPAPIPTELPTHPRLMFTAREVPAIKERVATERWAKTQFDGLRKAADQWLGRAVTLPPRGGQWYHYYSCPKHGARLRTEGPTRHVCPVDGEALTGYPYDDVVLMSEHGGLANAIRTLGVVYQLTSDARYAEKARQILLAYAAKYQAYPLHNIKGEARVGGGKVGPQTLDESTWLITVLEGADCIWTTLSQAQQQQVANDLLYPATAVIRQHKMSIHNIQCWKNSAVGLTGFLLGDRALIEESLTGESGYYNQMSKGVSADGPWYEGAWGYHFYTVSAVLHLTEAAFHCGLNLYGPEFKRMFDAPVAMAMPSLALPAFNDSHQVSLLAQAPLYETALARYNDERYKTVVARGKRDSLPALLHGLALAGAPPPFQALPANYPASGYAVLTGGRGDNATWLCLDYGPHGGGHGHPDKLGFVLYGLGRVLAPDPGTANYGVPIQSGWYRTTIAHNTLTVQESSQKAAEGQCDVFIAGDDFCAVSATAGKIYEGVNFRRTASLLQNKYLLFIDQVESGQEHVYDLAYYNQGKAAPPKASRPREEKFERPGYSYLRDTRQTESDQGLHLAFEATPGTNVLWSMAGGEPTTFITATGVGSHTENRVPVVITRRKTTNTAFLWGLSLDGRVPLELGPEPIRSTHKASKATAMRCKTATDSYVLAINPLSEPIQVAGIQSTNRLLLIGGTGAPRILQAAR